MSKYILQGIRILDFTLAHAGPFGTALLAQMGAEVIKIETGTRNARLQSNASPSQIATQSCLNASKYSITLNLSNPRGLEIAKRLVRLSDVVIENFRTGVMNKIGLGYNELKSIKPDIIMITSSILGEKGAPWDFAGGGPHSYALSAHPHLTGWGDRPPMYDADIGIGHTDTSQGLLEATATLIALDYKRRTGKGQLIDFSHVEFLVRFISPAILDYLVNNHEQVRMGNRSLYASPHGAFPCKGDDKWCVIAISTDEEWLKFCSVIGSLPWTKDPKFASFEFRKKNEDELERLIGLWTIQYTPWEIMHKLQSEGVPAGAVQDISDIMERDPQIKARKVFSKVKQSAIVSFELPLPPFRLDKGPFKIEPAPQLGEQNDYVYRDLLHISDKEYAELVNEGALS